MVKVEKPNPRSLKKDDPAKIKKIQMKKKNSNKRVKKISKTLESVAKNKVVKDIKQDNVDANKQTKPVQNYIKAAQKKTTFVAKFDEKAQKKTATPAEVQEKTFKTNTPFAGKGNENKNPKGVIKKALKKKQTVNLKEPKKIAPPVFELGDFDEEKFRDIVSIKNVTKISKALKVLVEKEVSEKKTSIFTDFRYYLNVTSYKIPNCPKRIVKLNVKHSLVDTKTDEVVMIVCDLQRGMKVDYEPTVQHFEDLLREIGEENIKVVPFNQLRNEYSSFEAKRKFANTYDYFLCDGRIVGHVVGFCGKSFQKPRTTLHSVSLNNPKKYKSNIEHALKRTSYRQLHKGDMFSIPVGNHQFTANQLAENVEAVIDQLKTIFPGGYANIRNIYLKIDIKGTSSLPLYVSIAGAPTEVPNVVGPREQRMIKLKKQANDILSKFNMSKSGDFVKLNKPQVERKQNIREACTALLSKEKVKVDDNNPPLKKKIKPDERHESQINSDDGKDDSDSNNEGNESDESVEE